MDKKVCVYTCITGEYDNLQSIEKEEGIDYLCFTNNRSLKSDYWNIIYIKDDKELGNMVLSRKIKMIGHPIIANNYDISIWVDGAIQIRGSVKSFLKDVCKLDRYNMSCFQHRMRDCVYEEAVACIIHRKADKKEIQDFFKFMEQERFPKHYGLAECTVLVRKHNDLKIKKMMSLWFELYKQYVKRDQLTFPYCLYKSGMEVCWIKSNVFDNPWFFWRAHRQVAETSVCRIFYGEYNNLYTDYYEDQEMESNGYIYNFYLNIPAKCGKISINLGKHFGRIFRNFKIDVENIAYSFFPGISISEYKVFDYDDLVVYLKGDFYKGQKICCSFEMPKFHEVEVQSLTESLVEHYYYNKIVNENKIVSLNHVCEELLEKLRESQKYEHLQSSPLFWKIKLLCERQDLKTKIIRKLILKFVGD